MSKVGKVTALLTLCGICCYRLWMELEMQVFIHVGQENQSMVSSVTLTPSLYTDDVRGWLAQTVEVEEEKLLVYITVVQTDWRKAECVHLAWGLFGVQGIGKAAGLSTSLWFTTKSRARFVSVTEQSPSFHGMGFIKMSPFCSSMDIFILQRAPPKESKSISIANQPLPTSVCQCICFLTPQSVFPGLVNSLKIKCSLVKKLCEAKF